MLLDIGIGILSAILVSNLFDVHLSAWLIVFAIISSLLPDIDTLFHMLSGRSMKNNKAHEHRSLWHRPLLYIPIGTALIGYVSPLYGFVFALTSFLHFLHDSIGIGWGVQWLYPFSKKHYSFFYQYDVYRHNLPKRLIYSWSPNEVETLSKKYGDKDWFKNIYLKCHPYVVMELTVFILSLVALYLVI